MDFKYVKYQEYNLLVQYLPSSQSVINLTMFHLILADNMILDTQGDSKFMKMINTVDYDTRGDSLHGFPIMYNTVPTVEWIKFFSGGLENLADYIIVSEHIMNVLAVASLPFDLFNYIMPIGLASKSDPDEFIVEGFRSQTVGWLIR